MLYSRYVDSRLFISSLKAMHQLCASACHSDLSDERCPLCTAYLVAYTCSRTFDPRPLDNMARLVGQAMVKAHAQFSWWERFYIDYVMVAARLDGASVLLQYLGAPGRDGTLAAVRVASLAYYLQQPTLLATATERIMCATEPQWHWEAVFARSLHDISSNRLPDLPALCSSLRESEPDLRSFYALDLHLLLLEMQPGIKPRHIEY